MTNERNDKIYVWKEQHMTICILLNTLYASADLSIFCPSRADHLPGPMLVAPIKI